MSLKQHSPLSYQSLRRLPRWQLALLLALPVFWCLKLVLEASTGYEAVTAESIPTWSLPYQTQEPASSGDDFAYSFKPIAYVFPQFHPIPENDEFWGENFTEWTNVKKVTHNQYGLETLRPTDEVGYYNLLDLSTRQRYAKLVKDSRLYGIVYHHYWFGRPVMERVLQGIIDDGEPNTPFMLSWANEPYVGVFRL